MAPGDQPPELPGVFPPRSAPTRRRRRRATPSARRYHGTAASARRGEHDGCSQTSSTTTSERHARVVGTLLRRRRARPRPVGGSPSERAAGAGGQVTSPLQEHKLDGRVKFRTAEVRPSSITINDDAVVELSAASRRRTSRLRAHTRPADPNWIIREALLHFFVPSSMRTVTCVPGAGRALLNDACRRAPQRRRPSRRQLSLGHELPLRARATASRKSSDHGTDEAMALSCAPQRISRRHCAPRPASNRHTRGQTAGPQAAGPIRCKDVA